MTFQLSFNWRFFASILLPKRTFNFSWTNKAFLTAKTQPTLSLFKNHKNIWMICAIFLQYAWKKCRLNFSQPRKKHVVKHFRGTKSINLTPNSGLYWRKIFKNQRQIFISESFVHQKEQLCPASWRF